MSDIIAKKLKEEGVSDSCIDVMAENFDHIATELKPVFEAWLNGEEKPFEFNGITIDAIRNRDKEGYGSAILKMSFLLEHPEYAEGFLTRKITIEDAEF